MTRFIPKPQTVEAVKWDGSPEGAEEVRTMLALSNYDVDRFNIAYTSEGKLDKRETKIHYYRNIDGKKPDREYESNKWREYSLDDGWLVVETPGAAPVTYSDERFKTRFMELGQVTLDKFNEWVGEAT